MDTGEAIGYTVTVLGGFFMSGSDHAIVHVLGILVLVVVTVWDSWPDGGRHSTKNP